MITNVFRQRFEVAAKQRQRTGTDKRWCPEPVRCPFCVQGDQFRLMVNLTGGCAGTFYCTACRHLLRKDEPTFQCLFSNCKNLSRAKA